MIMCLLLSITSAFAISNVDVDTSNIVISVEEVSPEPVEPGQDLTVKIKITNEGGKSTKQIETIFDVKDPFTLKSESNDFKNLNNLCAGCTRDNTYYLLTKSNAKSGIYPIYFKVFEDGEMIKEEEIFVNVKGTPDIIFESQKSDLKVKPNDEFEVSLNILNIGTGDARNIKLIPNSEDFIKLGSGIEIIEKLKAKESSNAMIKFTVSEDVFPDSYNIPIEIHYKDENGDGFTVTENYGVKVYHGADLGIQNMKLLPADLYTVNKAIEFHLRIENSGTGDAEKVKITAETEMSGNKIAYLGKIKKDDDEPTIFTFTPTKGGEQIINFRISYSDDFGTHSFNEEMTINVQDSHGSNSSMIVLGIILIAGIGIFFFVKK